METTYTRKEQAAHRELWVNALLSNEYQQAVGALSVPGVGMCCLGVACDVAIKNGVELNRGTITLKGHDVPETLEAYVPEDAEALELEVETFDGVHDVLPDRVRHWLGLKRANGSLKGSTFSSLTSQNDKGVPFDEIADLVVSGHVERV